MAFSDELKQLLTNVATEENNILTASLSPAAQDRLNRLAFICPIYRKILLQNPSLWLWLETPKNLNETFRISAFYSEWKKFLLENSIIKNDLKQFLYLMQIFRRRMSMRIAYREINQISTLENSIKELTFLAEFSLQTLLDAIQKSFFKRFGTPWNKLLEEPAKFCILGLGKLGAKELNFCSDVDLIYVYEGQGNCIKSGKKGITNQEFYTYLCQTFTQMLGERSTHGFLYNVDLRLRPDGPLGLIVRSFTATQNYYSTTGQTWERLALMKARPVAGQLSLGEELLEELNSFRYPRFPPLSMLSEIAGIQLRIQKEIVKPQNIKWDIKSGYGGIRELEFFVQGRQLLHAGKNPFLQNPSFYASLEALARYEMISKNHLNFFKEAYNFYRLVENRLQMQEEASTSLLPRNKTDLEKLTTSLGYSSTSQFLERLETTQKKVHTLYKASFPITYSESYFQEWYLFFSNNPPSTRVQSLLSKWFPNEQNIQKRIQQFLLGTHQIQVTREIVQIFLDISEVFTHLLPKLSTPLKALETIGKLGEKYGSRKQFFKTCILKPNFFSALATVFDQSEWVSELFCLHPEIIEELFNKNLSETKSEAKLIKEISYLSKDTTSFPKLLWLYVKAEQTRLILKKILFNEPCHHTCHHLTQLADATLLATLHQIDPENNLAFIALGKYGAQALTPGSDLDLIVLGNTQNTYLLETKLKKIIQILSFYHSLGPTYILDFRLRPYGQDGPLITTLQSFDTYHKKNAKIWEQQILTKARFVGGNRALGKHFFQSLTSLLYSKPISQTSIQKIHKNFLHIQSKKRLPENPKMSFKYTSGGITFIDFALQIIQLKYGFKYKQLRVNNSLELLSLIEGLTFIHPTFIKKLKENYHFLLQIEFYLRQSNFSSIHSINPKADVQNSLSHWLGFPNTKAFFCFYEKSLNENIQFIDQLLAI